MDKKRTRKSRAAKSVRDLPVKTVNTKRAKGVKGGQKTAGGRTAERVSLVPSVDQ